MPPIPPPRHAITTMVTADSPAQDPAINEIIAEADLQSVDDGTDDVENDESQLDNVISTLSSADNNNGVGSLSEERESNSTGYFSTSQAPPSPAPNDDDGGYGDDNLATRETTQAISVYT